MSQETLQAIENFYGPDTQDYLDELEYIQAVELELSQAMQEE